MAERHVIAPVDHPAPYRIRLDDSPLANLGNDVFSDPEKARVMRDVLEADGRIVALAELPHRAEHEISLLHPVEAKVFRKDAVGLERQGGELFGVQGVDHFGRRAIARDHGLECDRMRCLAIGRPRERGAGLDRNRLVESEVDAAAGGCFGQHA